MPKSSSTSCFKHLPIISFARKTNALAVVDLLAGSCICTWNKLNKEMAISPVTVKIAVPKTSGICTESLFNKVAGLQDCCKTYIVHPHVRFYFAVCKTLKKLINVP